MGVTKYLQQAWKQPETVYKKQVAMWAHEDVVTRLEHPTRIDKARRLGFKAKQGFVVVRTRIKKGGRKRPAPNKGRKPRSYGRFFTPGMNKQSIAERRVARKFPNLEVLNSYYIGESGTHKFYEVILVDPHHAAIKSDASIGWITNQSKRVFRGRTSAGKKSRGLRA
ncbi:MAG: 50S ribosomal protein L15e [Candidatus Aenigmarchaeota archaeon]|nr:50S ribosomal protein L15e [Candidatus Aenigmarchaeota archaeon]